MALINRISDLPEWYSLDKYAPSRMLDMLGWVEQLWLRVDLNVLIQPNQKPQDLLAEAISLIRETPIVNIGSVELLSVYFGRGQIEAIRQQMAGRSLGVSPITGWDLYGQERSLFKDYQVGGREFNDSAELNKLFTEKNAKTREWMMRPVYELQPEKHSTAFVRVNLRVPDKILMQQFEQNLRVMRKGMQCEFYEANYQQPNFKKWIKDGFLPYADLTLWAHETGNEITDATMANAIYAPGTRSDDTVRKVTRPAVDRLLSKTGLDTLLAIAAADLPQ